MKHAVIVGPQGAGKGTQATLLADRFNLLHLSTGDIFRALMQTESDLANEVRAYVDAGSLVPDDLTARVLFSRLDELAEELHPVGALFDGYPRNAAQADVLDATIAERGEELVAVVYIDVPMEVLKERIALRATTEGRSDDTPEALERRLSIYFAETQPLVERWRERGIVLDIDGDQSIEDVGHDIREAITPLFEDDGTPADADSD
ncbi:MAG: adenylate kinase [Thermomicrobiales bacterium]